MPTKLLLKRPLGGITLAVIRELHAATGALGHRAMLIGATARVVLIEHVLGLAAGRATRDVDFAFAMETWEQFEALRRRLIDQHGFTGDPRVTQTLFYQPVGAAQGIPIDLVPFGPLADEYEEIRWPPEMAVVMSTAGFKDALESAVNVEIAPDLLIAVASLPNIAVLKLFTWLARGKETQRDATDLAELLRRYNEIDLDRVYEIPPEALEHAGYDVVLAGAWLLGNDARRMIQPATAKKLAVVLNDPASTGRLVKDMARVLNMTVAPAAHAAGLLAQFTDGFGYSEQE
jgi:predicted nucleotidyltransferase